MWISNSSWILIDSYKYDSFGNIVDYISVIWNTRLFAGREFEVETGLYYNRARYYSPKLWRFLSRDPIDVGDDVNLYRYVGNNSVNYTDPTGKYIYIDNYSFYSISNLLANFWDNLFSVKEKQSEVIERVIDTVDEVMYNEADKLIFQWKSLQVVWQAYIVTGVWTCIWGVVVTAWWGTVVTCSTWGALMMAWGWHSLVWIWMEGVGKYYKGKGWWKKNYNQDKTLSDWEIRKIQKQGVNVHKLKPKSWWSKFDLFKDNFWDIYYKRKTWKWYSEPVYTDYNIKDFN